MASARAAERTALEAQNGIESRDMMLKGMQEKLDAATASLEEKDELLRSNQQVITWLNKEINSAQLGFKGSDAHHIGGGVGSLGGSSPATAQQPPSAASAYTFRPSFAATASLSHDGVTA